MRCGLTRPVLRLLVIVILFLPAVWLSLGILYLALPSPAAISGKALNAQALKLFNVPQPYNFAGSIFRIYDRQQFYPYPRWAGHNYTNDFFETGGPLHPRSYNLWHLHDRAYFALEFAWNRRIGSGMQGALEVRSLSSTEVVSCERLSSDSRVTSEIIVPSAKIGDGDGVTPPWFHLGDAILLDSDSRSLVGEVGLAPTPIKAVCTLAPEDIPDASLRIELYAIYGDPPSTGERPLISLAIGDNERIVDVRFPVREGENVEVADRGCWGLSRTYLARQILLQFLGPTTLLANAILEPFFDAFGPTIWFSLQVAFYASIVALILYMQFVIKPRQEARRAGLSEQRASISPGLKEIPQDSKRGPYQRFFGSDLEAQISRPQQAVVSVESMRPEQRLFDMKSG